MAAEEIPESAYSSRLLNRADAAEGTMAFQFELEIIFEVAT
jgi:hypothetical protein